MISSKDLREVIRVLERKLGVLEDVGFSCCGISFAQCHALVEIGRAGTITLNKLAEILNLENSTMSRTVNNLVSANFVLRDLDSSDRRYINISLTESGMNLYQSIEATMEKYFKDIFDNIPEDKHLQVIESIQILVGAIGKINCCNGTSKINLIKGDKK